MTTADRIDRIDGAGAVLWQSVDGDNGGLAKLSLKMAHA